MSCKASHDMELHSVDDYLSYGDCKVEVGAQEEGMIFERKSRCVVIEGAEADGNN